MLTATRSARHWTRPTVINPQEAFVAGYEARGKALYVAAPGSGSDSNSGKRDAPFATAEKGFKSAAAGNAIICRGGVRTELSTGGTPYAVLLTSADPGATTTNPIVFTNSPGEVVDIRGTVRSNWANIQFFTYQNRYLKINGWRSSSPETTLWWYGTNLLMHGVDLSHYDTANPTANTGTLNASFLGNPGVTTCASPVFRRCTLHDVHWTGSGNQPHGCYIDQATNALFDNCVIYGIKGAGATGNQFGLQNGPNSQSTVVRKCLFYDVDGAITTWTSSAVTSSTDISECVFGPHQDTGAVRTNPGGGGTTTVTIANCHTDTGVTLLKSGATTGITNNGGHTSGAVGYVDATNKNFFPFANTTRGPDWG